MSTRNTRILAARMRGAYSRITARAREKHHGSDGSRIFGTLRRRIRGRGVSRSIGVFSRVVKLHRHNDRCPRRVRSFIIIPICPFKTREKPRNSRKCLSEEKNLIVFSDKAILTGLHVSLMHGVQINFLLFL